MDRRERPLSRLARFVHAHFLWLMTGSYAVAAWFPAPGRWIRDVSAGEVSLGGAPTRVSVSMLMLAFLLLNSGLGVEPGKLREIFRSPRLLGAAVAANVLIPVAFIFVVSRLMAGWHN